MLFGRYTGATPVQNRGVGIRIHLVIPMVNAHPYQATIGERKPSIWAGLPVGNFSSRFAVSYGNMVGGRQLSLVSGRRIFLCLIRGFAPEWLMNRRQQREEARQDGDNGQREW